MTGLILFGLILFCSGCIISATVGWVAGHKRANEIYKEALLKSPISNPTLAQGERVNKSYGYIHF